MTNLEWYKSSAGIDNKPVELDTTSSETTVFQRRNITKVSKEDEMTGKTVESWEYEERKIPRDIYMLANLAAESVDSKREMDIINAYTEELISEGVI